MRAVFFALALILAASPAAADPVTAAITTWLVAAGVGANAVGVVSAFIMRLGFAVVLTALSYVLSPKPGRPRVPGIKTEVTTTGGSNPASFILGTTATAGNLVAPPYSQPNDGEPPNEYLTYVMDVSDIPGVELSRVILRGEYVDDLAASPDANFQQEALVIDGVPHFYLDWYDGTQTAACPYMLSYYATHPERPWSADMVGDGVAYAVVTFRGNREVYSGLPGVRFEVRGIPLYDPRLDTTVGGSGAQRWATPSTWAFTENPVVMVYNILRGISLPDGSIWGGRVAAEDLPLDVWFAAMNECDVAISLDGGGTEPQYRAGMEVSVDEEPAGIIEELLKACSAEIAEIGGVYKIRVGPPALPVYFFTDDDVIVDAPQSLVPYPGLEETFNAIHAVHPAPESLWETRDAPPLYNTTWETEDGGRRLVAEVALPAVASDTQVQRLMKGWIQDERRKRRHNLTLPPDAAILEPLDCVAWTSDGEGYTAKVFEVGETNEDPQMLTQAISIRERDASDFVWVPGTDQIAVSHPSSAPVIPAARNVPGFDVAEVYTVDGSGGARQLAIRLSWSTSLAIGAGSLEYEIRPTGQVGLAAKGTTTALLSGSIVIVNGILPGVDYEARARSLGAKTGAWTSWVAATPVDARVAPVLYSGTSDAGDEQFFTVKSGKLTIKNAEFLVGSGLPLLTTVTTSSNFTIPATALTISLELVGGGGGGGDGSAGSAGGTTTVVLRDGTTPVLTWTATGGAGGAGVGTIQAGEQSALHPAGSGGAGGVGGAGGSAGAFAGVTNRVVFDLTSPNLEITVGAGGAAGGAGATAGQPAAVRVMTYEGDDQTAAPISNNVTAQGEFVVTAGVPGVFPSVVPGRGLWMVWHIPVGWTVGLGDGTAIARVADQMTFVSAGLPVWDDSHTGTRTVKYRYWPM